MLLFTIGFRGSKSNGLVFWCWRPHMWHGGIRNRKVRNDSVWNIILFWYLQYILLFRTLYAVEFDSNAAYTFSQNHPYGCRVRNISNDFSSLILRFYLLPIIYIISFSLLHSFPQNLLIHLLQWCHRPQWGYQCASQRGYRSNCKS